MKLRVDFGDKKECRDWIDAFYDDDLVYLRIKGKDISLRIERFDSEGRGYGNGIEFTLVPASTNQGEDS